MARRVTGGPSDRSPDVPPRGRASPTQSRRQGPAVGGIPSDEVRFFARLVELAAGDRPTEARLAALLAFIAGAGGAGDVAVATAGRHGRTIASRADAPIHGNSTLAGWLEASLASGRGTRGGLPVTHLEAAPAPGARGAGKGPLPERRILVPPGHRRTTLAFAFRSAAAAARLEERFPPARSRAAASVVAALVRSLQSERELAELRRADAEQRRFVSVVAHELRTPLSSLGGYLDLVAGGDHRGVTAGQAQASEGGPVAPPDGERREFLDRARDLVAGMSTLVADLLELSRLDAGQLRLTPAPFAAGEVAQAAVRDVTPLAMERGITLHASLGSRLRTLHADRRRVHQVLVNLLGNAIKFAPPSSTVTLSLQFEGQVGVFTVRDQGPGVPDEERAVIFEPFHRAAGAERVVGTGLGLPIARDLARRMGGDIGLASRPGTGSTFVVALPATEDVDAASVAAVLDEAVIRADAELAAGA